MKTLEAGLISAGGFSKSFLARMPAVLRTLGPVKATSFRVARRITNAARAGHPVETYAALGDRALLWIALPEAALDRVLRDLSAEASLARKMIVICATTRGSAALRAPGSIATLDAIPGDERTLVAEGHPSVLREIRRIAADEQRKLIEIPPGAKAAYLAGAHLASNLLLPYFSAAVEMLREAGFSRGQATRIAEGLGARSLRSYAKAGTKAWNTATALDLHASRERDLASIRAADPRRGRLYERAIEQALEYFKD
ncbi:MAG TPA: DUF2520 domain-containing protein [Bryobacteraceae bacterium]|nr:DUF2520 domain-containing protein [Bryobacteraceae bacterium]